MVAHCPSISLKNINPWLFRNSYIYRVLLQKRFKDKPLNEEGIINEVRENLKELKEILDKSSIHLTVLVLPILMPYDDWSIEEKFCRDKIISILSDLNIRRYDLVELLNMAIDSGVSMQQDPGDTWHPSDEMAIFLGEYLYEKDILKINNNQSTEKRQITKYEHKASTVYTREVQSIYR